MFHSAKFLILKIKKINLSVLFPNRDFNLRSLLPVLPKSDTQKKSLDVRGISMWEIF